MTRAMKVDDLTAKTVQGKVIEHVELGSNIMSDEFASYIGLEGRVHHHTVNHSLGEYVRDYFCHVNGLEGAWSHFKRQVFGIHHWVSAKHIDRYLDEFTFRYNNRIRLGIHDAERARIAREMHDVVSHNIQVMVTLADAAAAARVSDPDHAADAMRSMYDMGDAPSCHTCGAIMVRNGSCYRCMSCGSTSGCS